MEFDYQKLLEYSFLMKHKGELRKAFIESEELQGIRIAVLCGSTFGVAQDFLELFLLLNGIRPTFWIGEYDRIYEEACFENPSLVDFGPEIILIHASNQNLSCGFSKTSEDELDFEKEKHEQIWNELEKKYKCTMIQNNYAYFPYRIIGNAARLDENGNVRFINELNRFIDEYAQKNKSFYVNDIQYLSALYGGQIWNDQRMWDLYKYAMSMRVMPAYANNIANLIKSILGKRKKLIITDLDNTLWGGIIGDDGADGIQQGKESAQGERYFRLQTYLKTLSKNGVLLGICSKNEQETALEGIRSKRSSLDEEDFVSKKINWRTKSENISDMLSELNLLEDSVVYLDDNPAEIAEVVSVHPKVEAILSEKTEYALNELELRSYFELTSETEEDKNRLGYYLRDKKRVEARKNYSDYDEYLSSLQMICTVDHICEKNIERASQLFNKTNQFNFLTIRYTCEELEQLSHQKEIRSFVLELDDKFGANGIVSIALLEMSKDYASIIGWIMSCRVLKRNLEYVMLDLICEETMLEGKHFLRGYYRATPKNNQLRNFFPSAGFYEIDSVGESNQIAYECSDLNGLRKLCKKHKIKVVKKEDK